jgi:hypothetical protein
MWNNIQPQPSLLHHLKTPTIYNQCMVINKTLNLIVRSIHHNKIIDCENFLHLGCYQSYKLQTMNNLKIQNLEINLLNHKIH